jgi:hypothetical protein
MTERTTELRICVKQATEAVEYYLNNHLLRETVSVVSVEFVNKDDQFKIIIKEAKDAAP